MPRRNRKRHHELAYGLAYGSWSSMRQRCTNPKRRDFARYGAVGISVCDRWSSFKAFLADVGPKPTPLHQLDRYPNPAGNYEPGNVRWATPTEQARNRRYPARLITFDGKTLCVKDWAALTGLSTFTIRYRLNRGWSTERALTLAPYQR